MSRIGKKPIRLPEGVQVSETGGKVNVTGPKGELEFVLPRGISLAVADNEAKLSAKAGNNNFYGLARAIIANMVTGVSEGFTKNLEIIGIGYRANVDGKDLVLSVGYSHPVTIKGENGIEFAVEKNKITVSGIDKQRVGAVAARIRAVRPPEPYKGKGIKYDDEHVRRKAGKAAVKVAGAK